MNVIQYTREDVEGRIEALGRELEATRNKHMKSLIKRQIRNWEKVLDRFIANGCYSQGRRRRNTLEEFYKNRELQGWTPYGEGIVMMGDHLVSTN